MENSRADAALTCPHFTDAPGIPFRDRARTAAAIPFGPLVDALAVAAVQFLRGEIRSPERLSVPLAGDGVSLSMPASAADIAIHKLVNVQPANTEAKLPSLHGVVTVSDSRTGRPLCFLDGPELTGRRTAGISLLGIRAFLRRAPARVLLIGTGAQSGYHVAGFHALYPACQIVVRGTGRAREEAFCQAWRGVHPAIAPCPAQIPGDVDVVITLTTSKQIVYDEAALPSRLVIGVGAFKPDMAEIGAATLRASRIYADDPAGARHEAGDLIRANVEWSEVMPLAQALNGNHPDAPVVLKSVGTAAWDLAAARVALRALSEQH